MFMPVICAGHGNPVVLLIARWIFPDTKVITKDYRAQRSDQQRPSPDGRLGTNLNQSKTILLDPPLYLREESIKSNYVYDIFFGMYTFMTRQQTAQEVFSELFPGIAETEIRNLEDMVGRVDPEFCRTLIEDRFFEGMDTQAILEKLTAQRSC
jgi:hypothetical protein